MVDIKSIIHGLKHDPPRLLLYGVQGVGKSMFAASAPSPIFIQTEDGLTSIDAPKFPLAQSYNDVLDAMRSLYTEDHDFKTLVVDSLDWLEPLIWGSVCEEGKKKTIEEFGYGKGYVMALEKWTEFLNACNMLRKDKGMAVILLAHSQIKSFANPETDPYDKYEIRLHKSAAGKCQEWADAVLFANYRVATKATDKNVRAIGSGERVVYTAERPAYSAKNRYNMPLEVELNWNEIAKFIGFYKETK